MTPESILTIVTVGLPILLTGWWRHRTLKTKSRFHAEIAARRENVRLRSEDEKIKAELRDELRKDNQDLRNRLSAAEAEIECLQDECGRLRAWILRLENLLRTKAPTDLDELLKSHERPA